MNEQTNNNDPASACSQPRRSNARPSGKGRSTRTGDSPGYGHVDGPECEGTTDAYDRCLQLGPETPPQLPPSPPSPPTQ